MIKFYGLPNNFLALSQIVFRFALLIFYCLLVYFDDMVKLRRIYKINGVDFELLQMSRQIYKHYPVSSTFVLMLLCVFMLLTALAELEMKVFNIQSLFEGGYYCVVTMTTVGYGDISAKSYGGQWLMTIATFLGIIFEGFFLVGWAKFTTFSTAEVSAYRLLRLDALKKSLKVIAASIFKVHWKLRKLANSKPKNVDEALNVMEQERYYNERLIYWNRLYRVEYLEYYTIRNRGDLR